MPTPVPDSLRLGALGRPGARPQDAVAAFQARGLLQPSFRWQDVWQEEHASAFAVAGVMQLDVLRAVRDELEVSISEGRSLADFAERVRPRLARAGFWGPVEVTDPSSGEIRTTRFDDRRLRLIFDVNLRQSHAAGRWARIERSRDTHPFVMYRTKGDEHVRASHRPWNGLVLPVEHEFWQTHFPPNGWRCRCTAFSVSERDIARYAAAGQPIKRSPPAARWVPYVNPHTGEVKRVPHGVDPGFGYNPGQVAGRRAAGGQLLAQAVTKADPRVGAAAGRVFAEQLQPQRAEWRDLVAQTTSTMRSHGRAAVVHVIEPAVMDDLLRLAAGLPSRPASAAVWMRDADLLHALRDTKAARDRALPPQVWLDLPSLLEGAQAYFDTEDPALVYAIDAPGGVGKVVVRINYGEKGWFGGERVRLTSNFVRTGGLVEPTDLQPPRYVRLGSGA